MSTGLALYPHAVSESLVLRLRDFDDPISGVALPIRERPPVAADGDTPPTGAIYDASGVTGWRKLNFAIEAEVPAGELTQIVPDATHMAHDTALVVMVTCAGTRYRRGVRLRQTAGGRWTGHGSLQRDDVRGTIYLRPQLVRTSGIPENDTLPYATKPGAVIAIGEPAALYVDAPPSAVNGFGISSSVVIVWEDFSNSDEPWRREHADDVYHLEPFASDPRLWLNTRYSQLREVLESGAKRGSEASLRDLTAMLIAQPVMLQLCAASLAALEIDEDSGSVTVPSGWRGEAVAMVLPGLYPEESSHEDRLRRAANELREGDGASSLMARLGSVVQELLASYKAVESAVRSFEGIREREEERDD